MAVTPISVPALNRRTSSPGQPEGPRQPLLVPGRPQAQPNRPEHAQGRIPVAAEQQEPLKLIEDIDRQVKASKEYQALRPYLEKVGLADEGDPQSPPAPAEAKAAIDQPELSERSLTPQHTIRMESELSVSFRISVSRTSVEVEARRSGEVVQRSDPLALDLNGNGLETTGVANGIRFDIDADGDLDTTSFITGGDAFVAWDRNGNGRIDDGSELFGDQNGDANGYEALARYDDNRDGHIDRNDAIFQQLRLLTLNADGEQRLQSLAEAGIAAIGLDYHNTAKAINAYDTIAQVATFRREDGSEGLSGDLLLGFTE
ncbi:MAG: hypothetical protein ACQETD_12390 [Pseudomonadota bacterium]